MKLPVFRAIGATFAFIAHHFVDVLKIVWLPLVMNFAAFVLIMPGYTTAMSRFQSITPGSSQQDIMDALTNALPHFALLIVITSLINLVLFAGLLRLLIRGEKPALPFYLAFGADELRLLGTLLAGVGIDVVIAIAFILLSMLAGVLSSLGPGPGGFIQFLAIIGLVIATIYVTLRLSLAAPATIDQKKIGLLPSWQASEEAIGPLLGYWILFILMMIVVSIVVGIFTTPPGYTDAIRQALTAGSAADRRIAINQANDIMLGMYRFSDVGNTIRMGVSYLMNAVISIVIAIAAGVAWRYLTGAERSEEAPATS